MKKTTKRNHKRKGFTLVELIAVMAILGILALLVIPRFADMNENAKVKVFENTARTLHSNIGMYAAQNNGSMPSAGDESKVEAFLPADWDKKISGNGTTKVITNVIASGKFRSEYISSGTSKKYYIFYDMDTGATTKAGDGYGLANP